MDIDELAPESEAEAREKEKQLIQDAKESKQEKEAKQNEALEAIAEGSDLEEYATVQLGELDMEVKAWLPGDTTETVQQAMELAESEDMAQIKRSMDTMLTALADMTTSEIYDTAFWRQYYQKYGPEGMIVAVEEIMDPASESMEDRKEGLQSFRSDEQRDGFRDGVQHGKRQSKRDSKPP